MCGYVGFSDRKSRDEKLKILKPMMDRIAHRGPDSEGVYANGCVALGLRRLFAADSNERSTQPAANKNGDVTAVLDGEIYNAGQLRAQLAALGHTFMGGDAAEVIVHGYEAWGKDLPQKLRGMFSFMLWDSAAGHLFGARDPFGIKPFYYAVTPTGAFLFGSEIKAFLDYPDFEKELNPDALRPYLGFQYAAGDDTFFKDVYSLSPGYSCVWKDYTLKRECFYDVTFAPDESLGFEESAALIDKAVRESVKAHRDGCARPAAFLSGGVDSSYIAACLMPEKSFSAGFTRGGEEAPWEIFDETDKAAELSKLLGIENHRVMITAEECFRDFPRIQYHMDQPQSNPSCIPLWFLSRLAKGHVKVAMSGEGADEFFAGYELYADTPAMRRFKRLPLVLRRMLGGIAKAMPAFKGRNFLLKSAERPENWFIGQADIFSARRALALLKSRYRGGPSPVQMAKPYYAKVKNAGEVIKKQYLDMHLWSPGDILVKADRMCMAHSLELRMPYLDTKMMELAGRIPVRHKVSGVQGKKVFRYAAGKTLPDAWASRPKKGFPVPIRHWLREQKYYDIVRGYFESEFAAEFFDIAALMKLLNAHKRGKAQNARKLWTVFTFLVWYKRFFIDESASHPK